MGLFSKDNNLMHDVLHTLQDLRHVRRVYRLARRVRRSGYVLRSQGYPLPLLRPVLHTTVPGMRITALR
jgi:hypothetical protein